MKLVLCCFAALMVQPFDAFSLRMPIRHSPQRVAHCKIRLMSEDPASDQADVAGDIDAAPTPERETAEEAWARAEEGSFLSPVLVAGLVAVSMIVRQTVFGGDSPIHF